MQSNITVTPFINTIEDLPDCHKDEAKAPVLEDQSEEACCIWS